MELLTFLGVPLERTPRIGRWTFDARIEGTTVLVEADGKFWHSSPRVKDRDARKDAWCAANGHEVIRVDELLFYANPMKAIDVILARWEKLTSKKAERAREA